MQMTRKLPFLLRNVRRGFLKRCMQMQVPALYEGSKGIRLTVEYEDDHGEKCWVTKSAWDCVLCHILGNAIKTREMLDCHLRWDHTDVLCEWTKSHGTKVSRECGYREPKL